MKIAIVFSVAICWMQVSSLAQGQTLSTADLPLIELPSDLIEAGWSLRTISARELSESEALPRDAQTMPGFDSMGKIVLTTPKLTNEVFAKDTAYRANRWAAPMALSKSKESRMPLPEIHYMTNDYLIFAGERIKAFGDRR